MTAYVEQLMAPLPQDGIYKDQKRRLLEGWSDGFKARHGYAYEPSLIKRLWDWISSGLGIIALIAGGMIPIVGLLRFIRKRTSNPKSTDAPSG